MLRSNLYALASAAYQPAIDPDAIENAKWIVDFLTAEIPIATVWSTRIALCKSIETFIIKCRGAPRLSVPEASISALWKSLKVVAGDRGYESVRTAAAKSISEFIKWINEHSEWSAIHNTIKIELPGILAEETSSVIRAEFTR